MFLKYFYDSSLAHASYMIGCQKSNEAIVVDPGRSIEPYLQTAKTQGLRIVGAAETHIHADFVSGSRELAQHTGARLYLSDEGPADWKYAYPKQYATQLLKDGDVFYVGKVKLQVLHTPGHTPESISFVLTDEGGGANAPMGIFTGDFVFVGSIGRPDLLETAAGVIGSADIGARQLYHSMRKFRDLPDHMQLWPAHGAGSACGKGLGAIPSSTVGYEKLFNPALQFHDEQKFVDYILSDQPETPFYFAVMKKVNKTGPSLLADLPQVNAMDVNQITSIARQHLVIDTTASVDFAKAHVPGTINITSGSLVQWAGFFADYNDSVYLITHAPSLAANLQGLRSIGIDNVSGYFEASAVKASGQRTESYQSATPQELRASIEAGSVKLIDVRSATEFHEGHIKDAEHRFLGKLLRQIKDMDPSVPIVAHCQLGGRSAIATSIFQRAGFNVTNMQGGYKAWVGAHLPVTAD